MKKLRLALTVAIEMALLAVPAAASAINYGGIGGKPANPDAANPRTQSIFIYELKPGQQVTDGLRVQNNTNSQQTIALDAVDSEVASGGNFTCKQAVESKNDVGAWIALQSPTVTVPANSDQVVPFTLTVPTSNSLSVGEHDGCITLQAASQTATPSTKSGIVLSFRSAIRVAVIIPGKIIKKLNIDSVQVGTGKQDSYNIVPLIDNQGNVSLDTVVKISLLSVLGGKLQTVQKGTTPVLPHDKVSVGYSVKRPFWGGLYRAQVVASYNANPATELGRGQNANQQSITKDSAVFLASPAPAALAIEAAVLLLLIGLVYWVITTRRHTKHVHRHWQPYTVHKGDTLPKLAKKHHVSWQKIAKANKLNPPYDLPTGDTIKLPAPKD